MNTIFFSLKKNLLKYELYKIEFIKIYIYMYTNMFQIIKQDLTYRFK